MATPKRRPGPRAPPGAGSASGAASRTRCAGSTCSGRAPRPGATPTACAYALRKPRTKTSPGSSSKRSASMASSDAVGMRVTRDELGDAHSAALALALLELRPQGLERPIDGRADGAVLSRSTRPRPPAPALRSIASIASRVMESSPGPRRSPYRSPSPWIYRGTSRSPRARRERFPSFMRTRPRARPGILQDLALGGVDGQRLRKRLLGGSRDRPSSRTPCRAGNARRKTAAR